MREYQESKNSFHYFSDNKLLNIYEEFQNSTKHSNMEQLALEEELANESRKMNLEYTFIAIGIISFFMLFILFSRKHITNTKVIQFLSVVSLLIVFEFLNLLIHPILEKYTP